MDGADALVVLNAEIVKGGRKLLAVPIAGAAGHQLTQHRGRAVLPLRIVDAAGRDKERDGSRLHVIHRLDDECQAIRKRPRLDVLLFHRGRTIGLGNRGANRQRGSLSRAS